MKKKSAKMATKWRRANFSDLVFEKWTYTIAVFIVGVWLGVVLGVLICQ